MSDIESLIKKYSNSSSTTNRSTESVGYEELRPNFSGSSTTINRIEGEPTKHRKSDVPEYDDSKHLEEIKLLNVKLEEKERECAKYKEELARATEASKRFETRNFQLTEELSRLNEELKKRNRDELKVRQESTRERERLRRQLETLQEEFDVNKHKLSSQREEISFREGELKDLRESTSKCDMLQAEFISAVEIFNGEKRTLEEKFGEFLKFSNEFIGSYEEHKRNVEEAIKESDRVGAEIFHK